MEKKKFWLSKTFWLNLLVPIVAYFVPGVDEWIIAHPKEVAVGWGVINVILRFFTKGGVAIK